MKKGIANLSSIIIVLLVAVSFITIAQSFLKYYLNRDFLLVDKINCMNEEMNCFMPDSEEEDPYKVLLFNKTATLTCNEKDASCNIDNICGTNHPTTCRLIGCKDNLSLIPTGYTTTEKCFFDKE